MKRKKNVRFHATSDGQDEDLARLGQVATMPSDELMETEVAILSGGHDQQGRPIISFPAKNHEVLERRVKASGVDHILTYFISLNSAQCQRNGFAFVIDMRRGTYELISIMKSALNSLQAEYKGSVGMMYAIQPHARQLAKDLLTILALRNSRKKKNKHLVTPLFQSTVVEDEVGLHNYIDRSQLTADVGGYLQYSHIAWLRFRSTVEPFFEKFQTLQPRLPIGFERMEELKKYNVGTESTQLNQTRQAMLDEYRDIREDIGIDHVLNHCEDLIARLERPEEDRLFNAMAHKPIYLQSRKTIEACHRSLREALQHIERLWREGEKRILDAEELTQFQMDVKEASEWLQGPGLHELKKHTEIAGDAGRAELLCNHFETSCLSAAKGQLARVDGLFQQADVMLINNNSNMETIRETVNMLKKQNQEFKDLVMEKKTMLDKVHRFYLLHKQVSKWYWKTLQFLPPDLPDVFNELKSKDRRNRSDIAIHEWQEDVKRFLKSLPAPSQQDLKELKSTSDVIMHGKLRRQARLLSHRCGTLKTVLDVKHVPSSKDILDALQWQENHHKREEAKEFSSKSSSHVSLHPHASDAPDAGFRRHNHNNSNSLQNPRPQDKSYGSLDRRRTKSKSGSFAQAGTPNGDVSRTSQFEGQSVRPKKPIRTKPPVGASQKDSDLIQNGVAYQQAPVRQRPLHSLSTVDVRGVSMDASYVSAEQDSPFLRALRQAPRPTSLSLQYINSPKDLRKHSPLIRRSSEQKIIDETYGIYGESDEEDGVVNLEGVLPSRLPRNAYAKSWVHSINSGQWPSGHGVLYNGNAPPLSRSFAQSMPVLNHADLSVNPPLSYEKSARTGRVILDPQVDYLGDHLLSSHGGPLPHHVYYSQNAHVFHSPPEYTSTNHTPHKQSGMNSMTAAEIKQITPPNPPSASDSGIGRFNSDSNLTYSDVLHNISRLSELNVSGAKTAESSPVYYQQSPSDIQPANHLTASGDSSPLRGTLGLTIPTIPLLAGTGDGNFDPDQSMAFLNASLPLRDRESPTKLTPKESLALRRQNSLPSSLMNEKREHLSDFVPKDGRTLTSPELADFEVERERIAMQDVLLQDKLMEERESQRVFIDSLAEKEKQEKRSSERKLPKLPAAEPVNVKISPDVLFQINEGLHSHQNGRLPQRHKLVQRHTSPTLQLNFKENRYNVNSYSDEDDNEDLMALLQQAQQQSMASEEMLMQERLRYEAVKMEHEEIIQKDLENRLNDVELTLDEEETILQQEALLDELLKDEELTAAQEYKTPATHIDRELHALEDKERLLHHQMLRRDRSIPLSDEGVMLDQVSLDSMEQGSIATTEKSSVESGLCLRYNRQYNYAQRPRKGVMPPSARHRSYAQQNGHL